MHIKNEKTQHAGWVRKVATTVLRPSYPVKGEVSGRRAREVMPEAIRALFAKRVKRCMFMRS
jgi:hypothetical protein